MSKEYTPSPLGSSTRYSKEQIDALSRKAEELAPTGESRVIVEKIARAHVASFRSGKEEDWPGYLVGVSRFICRYKSAKREEAAADIEITL